MKTYAGIATIAPIVAAFFCSQASSEIGKARDLVRRADYESARKVVAADTASLAGSELCESLLLLARIETDITRSEELYRRVMAEGCSQQAAKAALELALMAYAQGDYVAAVELLSSESGELSKPEASKAAYFLAMSWKQLGENGKARSAFSKFSEGDYWEWSQIALAEIELGDGKTEKALAIYERAAKTRAAATARFGVAECLERMGQKEQAEREYRSICTDFPNSFEASKAQEKIVLISGLRPGGDHEIAGPFQSGQYKVESKEEESLEDSFTLQFGAYERSANAIAASEKLKSILPAVRIERVEIEGKVWYRVRAGIYRGRRNAERDLVKVRERLGMSGTVVPIE